MVNVTNPNSYPIKITSVTGNGTITADSSHSTCGQDVSHPTGVTYTDQTGLSIAVPASTSQHDHAERHRPHEQRVGQQLPGRHVLRARQHGCHEQRPS